MNIDFPSYSTGDSYATIRDKCTEYARQRALDDLKSGRVTSTEELQGYLDSCGDALGTQRQIRQGLLLALGLGGATAAAYYLWFR